MGLMLKSDKDKLTLIFKGDGPAKQILATANGRGNAVSYTHLDVYKRQTDEFTEYQVVRVYE